MTTLSSPPAPSAFHARSGLGPPNLEPRATSLTQLAVMALVPALIGLLYVGAALQLHDRLHAPWGEREVLTAAGLALLGLVVLDRARAWGGSRGVAIAGSSLLLMTVGTILAARFAAPATYTPWPAVAALAAFLVTGYFWNARRRLLTLVPASAGFAKLMLLSGAALMLLPRLRPATAHPDAYVSADILGHGFLTGEFGRILVVLGLGTLLAIHAPHLIVLERGTRLPPRTTRRATIGAGLVPVAVAAACNDLGPALILYAVLALALYCITSRRRYPLIATALAGLGGIVVWVVSHKVQGRVMDWLHPLGFDEHAPLRQVTSARFSMAWTGVFGHGLGGAPISAPGRVPVATSDYALVQTTAELGGLVLGLIVVLYGTLIVLSWSAVRGAPTGVEQTRTVCVAAAVSAHIVVIVGGVSGLLPLAGLTSPLISGGASSAIAFMVLMAYLVTTPREETESSTRREKSMARTLPRGALPAPTSRRERAAGRRVAGIRRGRPASRIAPWLATGAVGLLSMSMVLFSEQVTSNELNRQGRNPLLQQSASLNRGQVLTADGRRAAWTENPGAPDLATRRTDESLGLFDLVGLAVPGGTRTGLELNGATLRCGGPLGSSAPSGDPARCRPADLHLTIDSVLQKVAVTALKNADPSDPAVGGVVVLDDRGAIRAWASQPTVSPSTDVFGKVHTRTASEPAVTALDVLTDLQDAPGSPLTSKVSSTLEPPGSTMKIVVLAAVLRAGISTYTPPTAAFQVTATYRIRNHGVCGGPVVEAFAVSCNGAFARLGLLVGPAALGRTGAALGLDLDRVPGLDVASAHLPADGLGRAETAGSAIGQWNDATSLLGMTSVGATISTDGTPHPPYVVDAVCRGTRQVPRSGAGRPPARARVLTEKQVTVVQTAMRAVVTRGTATSLDSVPGKVSAKTGTATTSRGRSIAWLIGYVNTPDGHRATVGVMLLPTRHVPSPVGGLEAAAVAKPVLSALASRPLTPLRGCRS